MPASYILDIGEILGFFFFLDAHMCACFCFCVYMLYVHMYMQICMPMFACASGGPWLT